MKKKPWKCDECPKSFETEKGLLQHYARKHNEVFRKRFPYKNPYKKATPDYDQETIQELNEISSQNYLRHVDFDIDKMNKKNALFLYEQGILKTKSGREPKGRKRISSNKFVFTEKGLKLVEELKGE